MTLRSCATTLEARRRPNAPDPLARARQCRGPNGMLEPPSHACALAAEKPPRPRRGGFLSARRRSHPASATFPRALSRASFCFGNAGVLPHARRPYDEHWLTAVRYLSTLDPLLSGLMSSLLPMLGTPFRSTTKSM